MLAGVCLPVRAQPPALADGDMLYCAQVYAEGAALLKADPDPGVRRTARDALLRSRALGASDIDLLNEDPARHKQASTQARQRLSAMPAAPLEARRLALRAAYVECRYLQAAAAAAPAPKAGVALSPASAGVPAGPPAASTASVPAVDIELDDLAAPLPVASPAARADITVPASGKVSAMKQLLHALASRPRAAPTTVSATASGTAVPLPGSVTGGDDRRASVPGPADTPAEAPADTARALPPEPRVDDDEILAAVVAAPTRPAADSASAPAATDGLGDADLLYCAQVYAETASLLGQDRNADMRRIAEDALRRSQPLSERDYDLLNEDPRRHAHASAEAGKRLSTLPGAPAHARRIGLRQAYAVCRELQEGKPEIATTAPPEKTPTLAPQEPVEPRQQNARPVKSAAPAVPPVPAPKPALALARAGLGDSDLLYCSHVYGEIITTFGEGDGEAAEVARDARERWRLLDERDYELLNDDPARHSRASTAARQRLATLPEKPGRARGVALRAAYEECRGLEGHATAAAAPAEGADRVQMRAKRHFCRDLLQSKLKVSPKVRAGLKPGELAALDEIQKIGEALTQPLPGAALTLEQDREASQLTTQLREALDRAVANRSDGQDPVVQAMGQCHEDYAQGLLGGPDVLSRPQEASPAPAIAPVVPAHTPVVRMADLGPVFHMREVTPAGNFDGIWFRRGRTTIYDAVWVQAASGQMQRDVLELRGIVDGELTLFRQSYHGSYRARVRPNGTLAPGKASWFNNAAYSWSALPPQYVRATTGDLGALVHMREVTPYGNYDGIWRQRGQTGVYDVLWVFLPTGEITADVLAVTGVAKGQLVIRRQAGPGLFPVKRRTDNMAARHTAQGGKALSHWVVLPAQSVRLGE